ncbi:MFS transporter [Methylorubrum zatmanii]|nr:MFS transporter [Methylorubrum zatmanii]
MITVIGLTQITGWGSSYYLLGVLAAPVAADTGWPLSWVVGGQTVGLLVAGLVSPFVGRRIDRHGGKPVLAASTLLLALGLVVLAAALSLPVYIGAWVFIGAGMGAGLYDAAFASLGRYFGRDARRAITIVTLFGGFASTLSWPVVALLVDRVGWRGASLGLAAVNVGFALPLLLTFLPRAPAREVATSNVHDVGALRIEERPAFLLLATVLVLSGAVAAIVSVHLLTLLQAVGLTLASAVALGAVIGPSQVVARVIEAAGGERHHPLWTLLAAMMLVATGVAMLWFEVRSVAAALVLYGAGNGVYSIARGTVPLTLFGPSRYAPIIGKLALASLLAQAATPPLAALLLERAGSASVLAVLLGLALMNVMLVIGLGFEIRRSKQRSPMAEFRREGLFRGG